MGTFNDTISSLDFHSKLDYLGVGGWDNLVKIYGIQSDQNMLKSEFKFEGPVLSVKWNPVFLFLICLRMVVNWSLDHVTIQLKYSISQHPKPLNPPNILNLLNPFIGVLIMGKY